MSKTHAATDRPRESHASKARVNCARQLRLRTCSACEIFPISGRTRSKASVASLSAKRSARVSISAKRAAASSFKASAFSVPTCNKGVALGSMPMGSARPLDSAAAARKPTSRSNCPAVSRAKSPPGKRRAISIDLCAARQLVLPASASVASPACKAISLPGMHCATWSAVESPAFMVRKPNDTAALAARISKETAAPATRAAALAQLTPQEPAKSAKEPPGNHRMAAFKSSTGSTEERRCTSPEPARESSAGA
mmetsp:Transcript_8633/g.24873  ORF Transcript_8633/g.24873 Transcript_8633/m.24873 type:complete len:254 (-) Transcript_8633:1073-1834(-)